MTNIKKKFFFNCVTGEEDSGTGYGINAEIFKGVDNVDMIFDSRGDYLGIRTCRGKFINGKYTCKKGVYDFKSFIELSGWKDGICLPMEKLSQKSFEAVNLWKER